MDRVVLLAVVALVVATGLCLTHADNGAPNLCLSLLAVTGGVLLTAPLRLTGLFVVARVDAYDLSPFDRPAPPPKA